MGQAVHGVAPLDRQGPAVLVSLEDLFDRLSPRCQRDHAAPETWPEVFPRPRRRGFQQDLQSGSHGAEPELEAGIVLGQIEDPADVKDAL